MKRNELTKTIYDDLNFKNPLVSWFMDKYFSALTVNHFYEILYFCQSYFIQNMPRGAFLWKMVLKGSFDLNCLLCMYVCKYNGSNAKVNHNNNHPTA